MKKHIKVLQVIPKLGYGDGEIGCFDLAHLWPDEAGKCYIAPSGGGLLKYINKKTVRTSFGCVSIVFWGQQVLCPLHHSVEKGVTYAEINEFDFSKSCKNMCKNVIIVVFVAFWLRSGLHIRRFFSLC